MNYDDFNQFCQSLPATTHTIQWGNAHIWKVGGKVFAIGGWEKNNSPAFTFKVGDADFLFLQDIEGFRPAPYMASRGMKWLQIHNTTLFEQDEIKRCIKESHRLIANALSKKKQRQLGLIDDK